ncbi:MAG: DUF5712 family protein [Alistipes senegalensis]|nr:DUF5712 family protein [Bacteroides cellulosilyticus]MCM1351295.1 DUF5712 family protein [Alistipes senegalensis]
MYITKFVDNTHYKGGSVMNYASYLEKERLIQERLDDPSSRRLSAYLDKQNDTVRVEGQEYFFNGEGNTFDSEQVTRAIDGNVKGLKKSEARYYTFAISPSREEIEHLRRTIADTRQALSDSGEVIPDSFDDDLMRGYLKDYAVRCMDAYARNFNHPQIRSNRDLLWFGMVEKDRYWKNGDREVGFNRQILKRIDKLRQRGSGSPDTSKKIAELEKRLIRECDVRPGGSREVLTAMMPKSGDNWHIHVCVSRRDITDTFSLSPNANGRGSKKHVLNGKSVRVGFDREAYKIGCEQLFDRTFVHSRLATESYEKTKALRRQGAFAYAKQLASDRAVRREERAAFRRAGLAGYRDYFNDLLQCESLDGRQLLQLKGFLARQLHALDPGRSVDEWMDCDLEELQRAFAQFDAEPHFDGSYFTESMAARLGDKTVETAGLQGGYRPVTVSYRLLRRGIAMRRATDRRREAIDRWTTLFSDKWYRENYRFESIGRMQQADTLRMQAEHLNERLGASVLLANAREYAATLEKSFVDGFLKTYWGDWKGDTVSRFARDCFGPDAADVRTPEAFGRMARERLLPVDARQRIDELAVRCRIESIDTLRNRIAELPPERATELTALLEKQSIDEGRTLSSLKNILSDSAVSVSDKEQAVLRSAFDDPALFRQLRDLKGGILKTLERQQPDMKLDSLQKSLSELLGQCKEIRDEYRKGFDKTIESFLRRELPGYYPVIEQQSRLENLIRELTPDPKACSDAILTARREVANALSPRAERIFMQESRRLFGPDAVVKNEHDFVKFVEGRFSPEQIGQYKAALPEIFARIEEQRRAVVQQYANAVMEGAEQWRVQAVRLQQGHINRYIDRKYPARRAKELKEELQQTVAKACRRPVLQPVEYKVFDIAARNEVASQALAKVGPVKLPVSPQSLAVKTAIKLFGVLTKGY